MNYTLIKRDFLKQHEEWTKENRRLTIFISLFSWAIVFPVLIYALACSENDNSVK